MDYLLREASDPATPPERLADLYLHWGGLPLGDPRRALLGSAVRRNPNLPASCLRDIWRKVGVQSEFEVQAALWYNPALPLLMLAEPDRQWEHGACWFLRWVQHGRQRLSARQGRERLTLSERIAPWAAGPLFDDEDWEGWDLTPDRLTLAQREDIHSLCGHLARLFSLPWPDASPRYGKIERG